MRPKEAPAPGAQTVRSPRHTVQRALRNTGVYCGGDFAVRCGIDLGMRFAECQAPPGQRLTARNRQTPANSCAVPQIQRIARRVLQR